MPKDQTLSDVVENVEQIEGDNLITTLPVTDPAVAAEDPDAVRGRAIIARRRARGGGRSRNSDEAALEAYQERLNEDRVNSRSSDQLIRHIDVDINSEEVLSTAMKELATEIHALGFQRERFENEGGDIASISNRRVQSLRQLMEVWFKRQDQLQSNKIDLEGLEVQVLLRFWIEKVAECLDDIGLGENKPMFFNTLQGNLIGWEIEAEKRIQLAKVEALMDPKKGK